jgi:hypothetical protein
MAPPAPKAAHRLLGRQALQRFIGRENIKHIRQLPERTIDEAERQRTSMLTAEEEARAEPVESTTDRARKVRV